MTESLIELDLCFQNEERIEITLRTEFHVITGSIDIILGLKDPRGKTGVPVSETFFIGWLSFADEIDLLWGRRIGKEGGDLIKRSRGN